MKDHLKICNSLTYLLPEMKTKVLQITSLLSMFKIPVFLFETSRSVARQHYLVKQGYSKTLKSRHLTGEAADFVVKVDGAWSWDYKKYKIYYLLYGTIAKFCGLRWRISWEDNDGNVFIDYPHSQLRRKA